jgi:FAD/FMN-containing dehydrogenase
MKISTLIFSALCWSSATAIATPAGCKKLPGDDKWPTKEILDQELPGWEPRMAMNENGHHPNWIYDAKSVASVQRAVKFAAKHNVRISVINSGHDFIGRNDAPTGLLLIVRGMKGVKVLHEFAPTEHGADAVTYKTKTNVIKPDPNKQAAVTFGPGLSYSELKAEMAHSGLWTVGAGHEEVSVAGGWSQAGGHGPLSSYFGLGCDNILEFKVVTPDGEVKIANAVTNPNLFWALRGGGASTFGVVVEATFKVSLESI